MEVDRMEQTMRDTIARVTCMERALDAVTAALAARRSAAWADTSILEKLCALSEYQESGLWLRDYEADQRGELPRGLKRGVLAQDTLYDLLCTWATAESIPAQEAEPDAHIAE